MEEYFSFIYRIPRRAIRSCKRAISEKSKTMASLEDEIHPAHRKIKSITRLLARSTKELDRQILTQA
jgi:hypothetical protein